MKVAIFADSFGDPNILPGYPDREVFDSVGLSWPELLSQEFDVTNFAKCGTGLYYSYKLFCEHHAKFDKIIILPSQAGRFTVLLPDTQTEFHCVPGFVHSMEKHLANYPSIKLQDRQVLTAAMDYIIHVLDLEREHTFNKLMVEDIKKMRPDTIIVDAFQPTINKGSTLGHMATLELEYWKITPQHLRNFDATDIRKCHLSVENNYMVFEKVKNVLNGVSSTVELSNDSFRAPTQPWQHYFKNLGIPGNI